MRLILLAMLLRLLIPSVGEAGEKFPVGPVFQASTQPGFDYLGGIHGPAMDGAPSGHFVVVWSAEVYASPSGSQQVRMKSFDESGGPNPENEFSADGDLLNYASWALQPSVGMDVFGDSRVGDFVVTWREAYQDAYSGEIISDIFARRFTWFYLALGQKFRVNTTRSENPENPKIAIDGAGNFVVVWGTASTDSPIYGQRYDPGGNPLGGEFAVSTPSSGEGFNPLTSDSDSIEVAANAAGEFMVVWKSDGAFGDPDNNDKIYARHYDSAGNPTTPGESVVQSDLSANTGRNYPAITADGLGNFVIVWSELGGAGSYGVRVRRFDAGGSPIGTEITATGTPDALLPQVAADASGSFVVVWENPSNEIRGRQFDVSGTPVGTEFTVPNGNTGVAPRRPDVASDDDGDFTVCWQEDYQIFGVRYGDFPALPCTPEPRTDCRESTKARGSALRAIQGPVPKRNRFVWRWTRGEATSRADYGAPEDDTGYSVCLYDSTGLLTRFEIGAGGPCLRRRCWRNLSGANPPVQYTHRLGNADGIQRMRLKPGDEGQALFFVRGKGENLEIPSLPLSPPVTAQLQGGHGKCWTAEFGDFIRTNASDRFIAVSGSAL